MLMIPFTENREVHIPVGDISIAMRFDDEEGLVFNHRLIPHICGKKGSKGACKHYRYLHEDHSLHGHRMWTRLGVEE